jgi:hypothetical protein
MTGESHPRFGASKHGRLGSPARDRLRLAYRCMDSLPTNPIRIRFWETRQEVLVHGPPRLAWSIVPRRAHWTCWTRGSRGYNRSAMNAKEYAAKWPNYCRTCNGIGGHKHDPAKFPKDCPDCYGRGLCGLSGRHAEVLPDLREVRLDCFHP